MQYQFKTVNQIVAFVESKGVSHFFDVNTMRFFKSKLQCGVYGEHGQYFITSEKNPRGVRAFTVRMVTEDGHVSTVGDFHSHSTLAKAQKWLNSQLPLFQ